MVTPSPDPSTWVVEPHLTDATSASMTASAATGDYNVYYGFTQNGTTVWQTGATYAPSGLKPGTTYSFYVRTRFLGHLPGTASSTVSFTTPTLATLTYPQFTNESLT
jgi:hypothetical protein